VGKPHRLELAALHSARRGSLRVAHHIDEQQKRVNLLAIEHRSDAYGPRR